MRVLLRESSCIYFCCLLVIYIFIGVEKSHAATLDTSFIFKISAQNSDNDSATVQTGFIVSGKKGIITALHGVAGKKLIDASNLKDKPYNNLNIYAVNIAHDLALLSSPDLNNDFNKTINGLLPPPDKNIDYDGLHILGCSLARSIIEPTHHLTIRDSNIQLKKIIPESYKYKNFYDEMIKRKSPDVYKEVLNIEGTFLPGHSGAPILNRKKQVVGVVNGSLDLGTEISWAIPYNKDIVWNDAASLEDEINRIAKLPTPFSCSAFQTPNGELFTWQRPRAGKLMTWSEARDYVKEMNRKAFKGHSDWRLPAVGELQDLAQFIKSSPGSYSDVDKLYWSSEQFNVFEAMAVNLGNVPKGMNDLDKQIRQRRKENRLAVRLVRSLVE